MTVADKYEAKRTLQKLVRIFGVEKRVKYEYARKLYEEGWFFSDRNKRVLLDDKSTSLSIPEAIKRQEKVEKILKLLPGKECSLCGSPDCQTFAEDVVDGRSSIESCILSSDLRERKERTDEG